jgi:hypothetical protein
MSCIWHSLTARFLVRSCKACMRNLLDGLETLKIISYNQTLLLSRAFFIPLSLPIRGTTALSAPPISLADVQRIKQALFRPTLSSVQRQHNLGLHLKLQAKSVWVFKLIFFLLALFPLLTTHLSHSFSGPVSLSYFWLHLPSADLHISLTTIISCTITNWYLQSDSNTPK